MKIAFGSDIHIEFGYFDIVNKENADVLVLAGDICVAAMWESTRCSEFFNKCADEFENVIYVLGNHEFYHGDVITSTDLIREKLSNRKNIHVLDNESLVIDGYKFIGSTLWTDCNNEDVMTEQVIRSGMNDYRLIRNGNMKLTPQATMDFHNKSLEYIKSEIKSDHIQIVISHHAPSQESIGDRHKNDYRMNGAFRSELDDFIVNNDIAVWIHGHTHHSVSYFISNTLVVSNQRGYVGMEATANNFDLMTISID